MSNYKKCFLALTLAVATCFSMTGCGEGDSNSAASSIVSESTSGSSESIPENPTEVIKFAIKDADFSNGIEDNGFISGVKAQDYITLPDNYKKIPIDESRVNYTEENATSMMEAFIAEHGSKIPITDRVSEKGDYAILDFVVSVDGIELLSKGENTESIIGTGYFLFDDELLGRPVGEEFEFDFAFPASSGEMITVDNEPIDVSGKNGHVVCTINELFQKELTDEIAAEQFKGNTLDNGNEIKNVADVETFYKEQEYNRAVSSYITGYLFENSIVKKELPDSYIEKSVQNDVDVMLATMDIYGYKSETELAQAYGATSMEDYFEKSKEIKKQDSAIIFIMQAIAEKENISVSDEDLNKYFNDAKDETIELYGKPYAKHIVLPQKVCEYLMETAYVKSEIKEADPVDADSEVQEEIDHTVFEDMNETYTSGIQETIVNSEPESTSESENAVSSSEIPAESAEGTVDK